MAKAGRKPTNYLNPNDLPTVDEESGEVIPAPLPIPKKVTPPPPREYTAAALTGILSRPFGTHPMQLSMSEVQVISKSAFDIAENMQKEEARRYAT